MTDSDELKPKGGRGFAGMSPERRQEVARKGGASVPAEKRSFHKNRELASDAGAKGGRIGGARRWPKGS